MRYSNRPYVAVILIVVLFLLWKAGTAYEAAAKGAPEIPATDRELKEKFAYLSIKKSDQEVEMTAPVEVNLSQQQGGYEITDAGEFHLTGKLSGTLVIDAMDQNVHLFLDNVSVTPRSGPALYCRNANKLVITLMPGTENIFSDSGDYPADGDAEACVYSECDLTINGTGGLTVNGYYKDAVRSKDIVKILGGVYTIKCKRTAIRGNDGIAVSDGTFMISSEKYGLKTENSGAEGRGNIIISGGDFTIIAGRYAFVTTKANLYIYNCTVYQRSVVSIYDVGGTIRVQEGCVQ